MNTTGPIRDLDLVALVRDVEGVDGSFAPASFPAESVGTVVLVYQGGAAFEVEFVHEDGQTLGFVTAEAAALRRVRTTRTASAA